jgi:hypothetical protein
LVPVQIGAMDDQLLELDMNITFKLIWSRHLVWNIEDNNLMEDTLQFGARPNWRAISAVLLKVVKLSRTTSSAN